MAEVIRALALALVLVLALASCSSPPALVPCASSVDCGRGEACVLGRCIGEEPPALDAGAGARDATTPPIADAGGGANDGGGGLDAAGARDGSSFDAGCASSIAVSGGLAYCTISAALAAAPPGSTVTVPAGVFTEALQIGTGLTLRGAGSAVSGTGGTVITSPSADPPPLVVRAANVTVDALILRANGGIGAQIEAQASLHDVAVQGAIGRGVVVTGTGIATLDRVVVSAVTGSGPDDAAIALLPGANATVLGSRIEDAGGDGIHADNAALIVRGTEVLRSGNYGIYLGGMSSGTIEDQTSIRASGFVGIGVLGGAIAMRDSESSDSGMPPSTVEDGLWLASPTSAIIERCTFRTNRGYGIYCNASVDADQCLKNVYMNNNLGETTCPRCN